MLGSSSASARTRPCTKARSTSTSARATSCASSICRRARRVVTPYTGDYYTQAKKETNTAIEETLRTERRCGLDLSFGRISVTEQVVAYQKKSIRDQSTLETVDLDLPETSFETEAIWYLPEPDQLEGLEQMPTLLGTLHAAEHSMIALLPLWAMCDRWDIGGLSTNIHFQTGRPTVFIYDGHSGGVGITERGFNAFEGWVADTAPHARGLPLQRRLPVVRAEPEVRQPQRDARQGRRADVPAPAGGVIDVRELTDADSSGSATACRSRGSTAHQTYFVAWDGDDPVGHAYIAWAPTHSASRRSRTCTSGQETPAPGIATSLTLAAETLVAEPRPCAGQPQSQHRQ